MAQVRVVGRARGTRLLGRCAGLLACVALPAGCARELRLPAPGPDVVRPPRSVIIFLGDGIDLTRFDQMVAAGELPNIKRRFVDGGVRVRGAVSSLPSVTYANCTSVITGVFPGHHGIMGNFWFDRHTLETKYYMTFETYREVNHHFFVPTLYEILCDHFTINIQDHTRRGVSETIDNRAFFGLAWFLQDFIAADTNVGITFGLVGDIANRVKRWPSVVMTYYPAIDEMGHRHGSRSAMYGKALIDLDKTVGLITKTVEDAGMGDSTYYVLVTDHSHTHIGEGHRFCMVNWLRKDRNLRVRTPALMRETYAERFERLLAYDVVGGADEDRTVILNLRGRRGWPYHPDPEEVEAWIAQQPCLREEPAVGLVMLRAGPDRMHVLARDSSAFVERRWEGGMKQYRLVSEQGDPLEYGSDAKVAAFVAAGWHASREWLAATCDCRYPDFVAQAVEMFDSPHTGDLVISAADDWSLNPTQNGGHGSALASDMRIPLFFAGADLPRGASIGPGRLVDVTPTVVGLVGEGQRLGSVNLDGIDLTEQLRHAK